MDALSEISTRATPQDQPARPDQVENNAGGYTFTVDADARLHRFLTLGTEGGTYYATEREVTRANAGFVLDLARRDAGHLARTAAAISVAGRAPRNNPAIFALAAASALGDQPGRQEAYRQLTAVCRTATHLFTFLGYRRQFAGMSRGLRRAVGNWYLERDVDGLAYQAVKYRQRDGWTHRDVLRLVHPATTDPARRALFDWICGRGDTAGELPAIVGGFEEAQSGGIATWRSLAERLPLSWEMYPDAALADPDLWRLLVRHQRVPATALLRQLPRMTRNGVFKDRATLRAVAGRLSDEEVLRRGRVHPVNVLVAARTYASGRSARGDGTWSPEPLIIDALDAAFYAAYGAIQPAGKRWMLGLDVSGSMTSLVAGLPISCREASAAIALVTMATEADTHAIGFTSGSRQSSLRRGHTAVTPLPISPRQRLDDAIRTVSGLPYGATDCALPMLYALQEGMEIDTFVVLTDNETWAGSVHPHQALEQYRQKTGIPARLAVVAMTPTEFSIADPADPGQLDVSGLDSAVPNLLTDFAAGRI